MPCYLVQLQGPRAGDLADTTSLPEGLERGLRFQSISLKYLFCVCVPMVHFDVEYSSPVGRNAGEESRILEMTSFFPPLLIGN